MSTLGSTRKHARRSTLGDMDLIRRRWPYLALLGLAGWVLASMPTTSNPRIRVGLVVTAAALLMLLGHRRFGLLAVVLCYGLMAVAMHLVPNAPTPMFLGTLTSFAVTGTLATRRDALIGWGVGAAVVLVTLLNSPATDGVGDILLTLAFCTIIWAAALFATERGRHAAEAEQRAAVLVASRDADVASAIARERERIAGELHDIVSHGLSIVVLQTVAARNTLADEPVAHDAVVDRRLEAVESTARDALNDMRRLLDVLQLDGEPDVALEPSVGLAQLPVLLDRARAAGQPVQARVEVGDQDLPAGLGLTAYRIVQECLTNAFKHAPGAPTTVDVCRAPSSVIVEVRTGLGGVASAVAAVPASEPAGHSPVAEELSGGFGLVGIRERVRVFDGNLTAGAVGDGFVVRAELPLPMMAEEHS